MVATPQIGGQCIYHRAWLEFCIGGLQDRQTSSLSAYRLGAGARIAADERNGPRPSPYVPTSTELLLRRQQMSAVLAWLQCDHGWQSLLVGRDASDEMYVLDLCDRILCEVSLRQHRFEWLLGDLNANGRQAKLPVDAYWPGHRLVVEYREIQHDGPVPHFDKAHVVTVSGVHRGEQRAVYDARRDELIPRNGLRLVVIKPSTLAAGSRGRLLRHAASDQVVLSKLLLPASDEQRVLDAFRCWLISEGWTPVVPTDAHTDIEAVRGDERIIGEAKGHTTDKGTDADTGYSQ